MRCWSTSRPSLDADEDDVVHPARELADDVEASDTGGNDDRGPTGRGAVDDLARDEVDRERWQRAGAGESTRDRGDGRRRAGALHHVGAGNLAQLHDGGA